MRILEWNEFISGAAGNTPLNLSIGVFDGLHRGHQALIREICSAQPQEMLPQALPALITFRDNPLKILNPQGFPGDIYSLERKMELFSALGVKMTVLIDFSGNFSTLKGSEFLSCVTCSCSIRHLVLGENFRCGYKLDTGVAEIEQLAGPHTAVRSVQAVAAGGSPVSSSRIRSAVCAANFAEASLLLGRRAELDLTGLPVSVQGGSVSYNAAGRALPPDNEYRVCAYAAHSTAAGTAAQIEMTVSVQNRIITVPDTDDTGFRPVRLEFIF